MRKASLLAVMVIAVGLIVAFATNSYASPSSTQSCVDCHSGTGVTVSASLVSSTTTNASYDITGTGGTNWAVFDGAIRVAEGTGTAGQFTVARGKTYDVFAVKGPTRSDGFGQTSVSPAAPPSSEVSTSSPDTTPPVTVSDALSTYEGTATINLTATDNLYGWGVAYIYYRVDEQPTRLSRVLPGVRTASASFTLAPPASGSVSYRVSYWAQDNYGNVEARTFKTITVTFAATTTTTTTLPTTTTTTLPPPTSLTIAGPSTVTAGRTLWLTGMVAPADSYIQITRYRRNSAGGWDDYGRYNLTADSDGMWSANVSTTRAGSWAFTIRGAGLAAIQYVIANDARLTISGPSTVTAGRTFWLTGTVAPANSYIQITRYLRNSAGGWDSYGRYNLTARPDGTWSVIVSTTRAGSWAFTIRGAGRQAIKYVIAR